jgi:hypothetical protein
MNIDLHIFDRLKRAYEYRQEPEEMHVIIEVFWRSLLSLAVLLVVFALWYGFSQLLGVLDDSHEGAGAKVVGLPLDKTQLEAAVQALEARQVETQTLTTSPINLPDPSLTK